MQVVEKIVASLAGFVFRNGSVCDISEQVDVPLSNEPELTGRLPVLSDGVVGIEAELVERDRCSKSCHDRSRELEVEARAQEDADGAAGG